MRILHTSDWHLGKPLCGFDRTNEQYGAVKRVLDLAGEHKVDVLLVTGDVFEGRGAVQLRILPELTRRLVDLLAPHVRAGLHVVLVPGNHDDREHFSMLRRVLALEAEPARVHVVETVDFFEIDGVRFGVIPYPRREVLAPIAEAIGLDERNVVLSARFADAVRFVDNRLTAHPGPTVFAGHVTVQGVTTPSEHEITYASDLLLGRGDLPGNANLSYIALGHIHQSQRIDGPVPCYYSGSLDRLDFGEIADEKKVLLVDIPTAGPASVTEIPLETTPFYRLDLSAADVHTLPPRGLDLDRAFVHVRLTCEAGDDRVALKRQIEALCPRIVHFEYAGTDFAPAAPLERATDYAATALGYARERLADDPDLPALLDLAQQLIQEVQSC